MNEKAKHTTEATTKKNGRTGLRILLKTIAWVAGIWICMMVVLQIALSPGILTKVVNKLAAEYVDGTLSFGKVRLTMFRHFPNVGISMEDCSLTYPAERFDSLEMSGAQGELLRMGCGQAVDTLASFKRFSAGINVAALIAGKISIPHIILSQPRIYAHSYNEDNTNWDILKTENDSTKTPLPAVSVGRIRLVNHPHIVYTDSQDTLFAMMDVKRMSFDGRIDTRRSTRNRIGLSIDSLIVGGRIAYDTLGFRLSKLDIHEHEGHMDILAQANTMLATHAFGRMNIPISINGTASFPKDTVPALKLDGFNIDIASIPISLDASLRRVAPVTEIDGQFRIKDCNAEDVLSGFISNIIPQARNLKTDAIISMQGSCKGAIGNGVLPAINAVLEIPDSHISHKDIDQDLRIGLSASASTDTTNRINVTIENLSATAHGLELGINAGVEDITGEDPAIDIDGKLAADLKSLASMLPNLDEIKAEGKVSAQLKGRINSSQISIYNFAQATLEGFIASDSIVFISPKDSISIEVKGLDVKAGPESKVSRRDPSVKFDLLAISAKIGSADISYRNSMSFNGKSVDMAVKNAVEAISERDTTKVYPLGSHINAESLSLTDAGGLSVSLDKTSNSLQLMPKKDNPGIPVLSVSSTNKRIYVRDISNRLILTDASMRGRAAMNTVERIARRKALLDSLAAVYPDVERDSLLRHHLRQRRNTEVPQWMREEDFKAQDINIRLNESLAKYFREWDVEGSIKVRTGIAMTPYLPIRNILKGMDITFDNNQVRIDSLKVNAGKSVIGAKGSLSGLRRALMGRGTYILDMDLNADKMDADELLAAFNAGASFTPPADEEKLAEASDSEFLQMVVADSLDSEKPQTLLVIPADVNADIRLSAKDITYSGLEINSLNADILMKERCMQILNTSVVTNVGTGTFEGFYATRSKKDIRTGFDLGLSDVTSEKVISMMPAIDTIMPLLKSFKGLIDCEIAATASLDTCMNIIMPSINGVIRIGGENLSMSGDKVFTDLAKKLKFKDRKEGRIDKMTVEGVIQDNTLEVFPFIVDIDRYTLALSGKHNLDQSFRYHASIIRSPMVFKVGVDIYGPNFDKMKFKIGKPKYKNTRIPVFTEVIDQTRINLAQSIKGIFEKGVEAAVRENERQEAIESFKKETGYVNAVDQQMEELSDDEKKQIEESGEDPSEDIVTKEKTDTLNEQSGIH